MNTKEYVENVLKTESIDFSAIVDRISSVVAIRLDHAADGLVTEAGEFKDALKKHKFYGRPIDTVNLIEELGDLMWYVGIACDVLGVSLEQVMEKNIAKLQARYGDKFSETKAENRNLNKERNVLEHGRLAMMCEHANEVPSFCPCDPACYCKTHTCAVHYRIGDSSMINICGIVSNKFSYSTKDITCELCQRSILQTHG